MSNENDIIKRYARGEDIAPAEVQTAALVHIAGSLAEIAALLRFKFEGR